MATIPDCIKVGNKVTRDGWEETLYLTVTAVGKTFFLAEYDNGIEVGEIHYRLDTSPTPWREWTPPFPFNTGDWVQHKAMDKPVQVDYWKRVECKWCDGGWDFAAVGDNGSLNYVVYDEFRGDWRKVDPPVTTKRFLVETENRVPTLDDNFFSLANYGRYKGKVVLGHDVKLRGENESGICHPTAAFDPHGRGGKRDVITKITEL